MRNSANLECIHPLKVNSVSVYENAIIKISLKANTHGLKATKYRFRSVFKRNVLDNTVHSTIEEAFKDVCLKKTDRELKCQVKIEAENGGAKEDS